MKTTSVLARLIPSVAAVRGSGAFNVVIASQAPRYAEELRVAANDDLIAVDGVRVALAALAAATEFEPQQQAMADVVDQADTLLGAIVKGDAPKIDRAKPTVLDLARRIDRDVLSVQDVYRPDQAVLRRIRADAAEMSALVDAEIGEGTRDEAHGQIAAFVYDAADRMQELDHATRDEAGTVIARRIGALAA